MAIACSSENRYGVSIPSVRLTRAGKGTTFCRTHELGRTDSSLCNRPTAQQSPHYAILERAFEIVVANAEHVKKVPGRKTDVKDAEWIADLLCHGLLRPSFVPPMPIRELRDLTRYRRKPVESQSAERNRLLELLETANIKLASVASDVFEVSGLLMLQALVEGKATALEMAELAKRKLRKKIPELELALEGKVEEYHRFLLSLQLLRLQAVEEDLGVLEQRIQEKLKPNYLVG